MKSTNLLRRVFAVGMLCCGAIWGASASADDTLRLGHNRVWSNPALILALSNGRFKHEGVAVVEHEFNNPADIITAIAGGDLDAGAAPGSVAFTAAERGVKLKIVALLQGDNNPTIAYTVRADSDIHAVKDLRGKIAGITNYGGSYDIYLRYWLNRGGVDLKDVNFNVIPVPGLVPALINKQVDIVPLAAFAQSIVEQRYPGKTRILFTYSEVMKAAVGSPENNGMVLVMSDAFINQHRAMAVDFLKAYVEEVRAVNADKKKAMVDWANAVHNPALRKLPAPPTVPDDGKVYRASLQFDADQALRYGYLKTKLDVGKLVDDDLLDAAMR